MSAWDAFSQKWGYTRLLLRMINHYHSLAGPWENIILILQQVPVISSTLLMGKRRLITSLGLIISKSIHVAVSGIISLFFMAK